MSVKFAVKLAAFSSAAVVVVAIVTAMLIVRDINTLYDEIMNDMNEFREASNGAWDGMLVFTMPQQREARHIRRQAYATGGGGGGYQTGGHAAVGGYGGHSGGGGGGYHQGPAAVHNAGASSFHGHQGGRQANKCPPGPPGPPGTPGIPGEDGEPGQPGQAQNQGQQNAPTGGDYDDFFGGQAAQPQSAGAQAFEPAQQAYGTQGGFGYGGYDTNYDPEEEERQQRLRRLEDERNQRLQQKANIEREKKQEKIANAVHELAKWSKERDENIEKRKQINKNNQQIQEEAQNEEKYKNSWDKIAGNIALKEGEYPGTKDVTRFRQSILNKKIDVSKGVEANLDKI